MVPQDLKNLKTDVKQLQVLVERAEQSVEKIKTSKQQIQDGLNKTGSKIELLKKRVRDVRS